MISNKNNAKGNQTNQNKTPRLARNMVVFLSGEAMGIILQFTEFSKLSLLRKHYVFKREKKTC